ncbi:VOC family protein [Castellaniella sp.]|uniref:VOC family protein n=1 Tax=Castellaniella sp. TaxID=1955812 RepID=UPI003A4DFFAD
MARLIHLMIQGRDLRRAIDFYRDAFGFQETHRLKGTVVLAGTLSAGTLLAALAPSRTWALEARVLDRNKARDLLLMARRLYPAGLLFPGLQGDGQVVDPVYRNPQGGSHRPARPAGPVSGGAHRARPPGQGQRRGLFRPGRQGPASSSRTCSGTRCRSLRTTRG